jgi:hypothetical protein
VDANFTKTGLRKMGVLARTTLLAKKFWMGFRFTTGAGFGGAGLAGLADAVEARTNVKRRARRRYVFLFIGQALQ